MKRSRASLLWLLALLLACLPGNVSAERYLSATEAQRLMFPEADRFEAQTVRFTKSEISAIEKLADSKVANLGNRLWLARQGTNLLGVLVFDQVRGKHELIDYAVAITPDGKVRQIEVLEYRESHGSEIRSTKWRAQFRDKTTADPLRLHADIFNLSGATISCRNVTEGVKRVLATFELLIRPRFFNRDTAP